MDMNKHLVIELVGANEKDKNILVDYFETRSISNLFIDYEALDLSDETMEKIASLEIVLNG